MPPAKRPLDGFAVASLVTGILSFVPVSVGLGIAALVRSRNGRHRGRTLAVAGLAVSLVWIGVVAAVFAYRSGRSASRDADGSISRTGQLAPGDLEYGDCVQVPRIIGDASITSLTVTPCDQSHNGQVFSVFQADDAAFPGDAQLEQEALASCKRESQGFLGTDETVLHVVVFVPTEAGWGAGARWEKCLLVDRQKDFRGDVRNDH